MDDSGGRESGVTGRQDLGLVAPGTWLMHIAANLVRNHEASDRLSLC
jgi:hypothetical protein